MPPTAVLGSTWTPPVGPADVRLNFWATSHPGAIREINEDGWFARPPVFVVADGMGGHRAGDAASAIVVQTFDQLVRTGDVSAESVERCIALCRQRISGLGGDAALSPGSTLIAATYLTEDDSAYWLLANIGDSRAYLWTGDSLEQVSHDHSVVQELIDAGEINAEAASTHPERHVVTRALGPIVDATADYSLIPVVGGTSLLLCSDGVTSEIPDATLSTLLGSGLGARGAAEAIVAAAVRAGGHDNATAVVVEVQSTVVVEDTMAGKRHRRMVEDTVPGGRGHP